MKTLSLELGKALPFLEAHAIENLYPQAQAANEALEAGTCAGNDFLGWLHLPSSITEEHLNDILATAQVLRENCDTIVVAGIGGSYLGARAVIEALGTVSSGLLTMARTP